MLNKKSAIALFLSITAAFALTSCNTGYDYNNGSGNRSSVNRGATNNSTDIGAVNGTNGSRNVDDGLGKGTGVGADINNAVDDFAGDVEDNVMGYTNYR